MNKAEAVRTIWDYLNIRDKLKKADAVFILGGSTLAPVYRSAEIFEAGWAREMFFCSSSGTFSNPNWKKHEAEIYYDKLVELGIPTDNLHKDILSSNTLEEAKFAIPFIKKTIPSLKKLILISRPMHQRRAYATFKKQHPEIEYINAPGVEKMVVNSELISRLLGELDRLEKYASKGDIVTQTIPQAVNQARIVLKK